MSYKKKDNTRNDELERTGAVLRDNRMRLGITQQQAADAIGCNRTSLIAWEQGRTDPSASSLLRYMKYLVEKGRAKDEECGYDHCFYELELSDFFE